MAVDDARFRRQQRADARQFRLERARGVAADKLQPFDAVLQSLRQQCLDLGKLRRIGRDDELAAFVVADAVRGAEFVEHAPAVRAVAGAQRAGRIVDAGMDHLAVARGYPVADAAGRLGDGDVVAGERRRARDGKPDDAGPDDENLAWFPPLLRLFYNMIANGEPVMAEEANSVVRVCAKSEVAPGSVKAFAVGDKTLAVYNIDGTFYVTDDECTHAAASLADGMIDGDVIECCMHMGSFHIPTGKVVEPPCEVPLRTYQVVLQDEDVFADLGRNAAGEPE